MASNNFTWTSDTLTPNIRGAHDKAVQFLSRTTAYYSLRAETYAKSKAPWQDRTGNARSGLVGDYEVRTGDTSTFTINISHSVPYGIWLEVRFKGKWGIIDKTIYNQGQAFWKAANKLLAKMFGGEI